MAEVLCVFMWYWDVNVELLIGNNSGSWEVIIWYGRCGVCGQGILRCKCGIVNWKYVKVGVGRL
jgi:hypothetical protein